MPEPTEQNSTQARRPDRVIPDDLWQIDDEGEVAFGKRCAWCGVAGTVLTWRPMAGAASSPLEQPAWYPTMPVREAKVTCGSCGCASYGLLVPGLFVVLPLDRTVIW